MKLTIIGTALLIAACGSGPEVEGADAGTSAVAYDHSGEAPVVLGTAIEASTSQPLAGVRIEGPGGTQAISDADGRFVLRGLAVGMEGELKGTTEAGLKGVNRLRPLKGGQLEVVLFLR